MTYPPSAGTFDVTLTNSTTGQQTNYAQVSVTETGSPTDTTLNSLAASLNGINGVQANVVNGQLSISSTNPNVQISFSNDTSGVLSSLGINTFFTGSDASSIGVNSQAINNPATLATSLSLDGSGPNNKAALAISNLNDTPQASLAHPLL